MTKQKLLALAGSTLLALGGLVSCGENKNLETVKVGFQGNFGAAAGMTAVNEGYFEEFGIKADYSIATGPNLATSVLAGTLDVVFLGNGVAWNYFTENSTMKLVALDNLTDDDRLIATTTGKGKDLTLNSTHAELVAALKGSTVALDLTTTPGTFWASLVNKLNSELAEGEKMWYTDGAKKLPTDLDEASYANEANQVKILNATTANLPTTMQQDGAADFCVAFAPVASTLEKDSTKFKTVAKTSTHMSESYTPSTWAVNTNFLKNHESTFKNFMKGLVKGMDKREKDPETAAKATEAITAQATLAKDIATDIAVWLGADKQIELCGEKTGKGYTYAENIRTSALKGANAEKVKKTVADAVDFSYVVEAAKAIKG